MLYSQYIHFAAAIVSGALAYLIIMRHPRSLVHRVFAFAVFILTLESLFNGLSLGAATPDRITFWQQLRWGAAALLPVSWITFGLIFGQKDPKGQIRKWWWIILAAMVIYPALLTPIFGPFFSGQAARDSAGSLRIPLAGSGYTFTILFILGIVLVMALMERILRASRGIKRWQVKFLILGIVAYFGARIFTASLALLFHSVSLDLETLNAAALIVTGVLIMGSFVRTRVLPDEMYISPRMIQGSITITLVGLYLIVIGIIARFAAPIGSSLSFDIIAFLVFMAFLGLSVVLLSDRIRQSLKRFVSRHFQRPTYNYRNIWEAFTRRTSAIVEIHSLCNEAAKLISETIEILSVNILLKDNTGEGWRLCGSTAHSDISGTGIDRLREGLDRIAARTAGEDGLFFIQRNPPGEGPSLPEAQAQSLLDLRMRYFQPLVAGDEFLGLLAMDEKVGYEDPTVEEEDLIRAMAGQLAGGIHNIRLSDQLREAKQMETLQTFSAFFVHDLKNLSSRLSMTLQNLPEHFDNPEFREDSLRLISQSVGKINDMTSRMTLLREKVRIEPRRTDLNELVKTALADLAGTIKSHIDTDCSPLPETAVDPEQIAKVLTNLILNANEANGNGGGIRVSTCRKDGWIVLSVSDDGCGISAEYMETSLFRPFKTTKKHGLGIGLYHSRTIVEAHHGRIEAESREGVGSTFRVFLPIGE